ncbi:MAG: aminotransferase class V-fold PLP-dependent enzyme, partial [Pseudomonadota bacterium]
MTGVDGRRVYLDWNATAPLRPEAREAMLAAMDVVGNPSSVHAEGRAAKKIVETARAQVADLVGCEPPEVVFTSGATEAAATALNGISGGSFMAVAAACEHECVLAHCKSGPGLQTSPDGIIILGEDFYTGVVPDLSADERIAIQSSNSETGVIQPLESLAREVKGTLKVSKKSGGASAVRVFTDMVQSAGKTPCSFLSELDLAALSSHKLGGPKGVGCLLSRVDDVQRAPLIDGGGQEQGRRSGTENVMGIAGFGAAAAAAKRDLEAGVWDRVEKL